MDDAYPASLKGHFLLAMPSLADPNFTSTVTCICENTREGAMGVVVNRLHAHITAREVFQELKIEYNPGAGEFPVFAGGPVHVGELFILHGPPFHWAGCLPVTPSLALSNTLDILSAIARGEGPDAFLIILGCAGWGPGQLEAEMKANAWLTCHVDEDVLFRTPVEERWAKATRQMGIDPFFLSDTAGHA